MLGLDNKSLLFPRLVYLRDTELVRAAYPSAASNPPSASLKPVKMVPPLKQRVRLYRLEWDAVERKKEERAYANYERMLNPNLEPFFHPLAIPSSYASRMGTLVFAISDSYMKAINHSCRQAMMEWEHPYPFDTAVRENCLEPAEAFIKSAIRLLADCIYDEEHKYFNRDWETKVVFEHTATLRFWRYQMGAWACFNASGLKIVYGGPAPVLINTWSLKPRELPADSRIRIMEQDMLEFHNSLLRQFPIGPKVCDTKEEKVTKKKAKKKI